jgi:hypothetical protein
MKWEMILKNLKPRWSAFFSENDITEFIKDAKKKSDEDFETHGFYMDQFYALSDKYNIPRNSAQLILRSHNKDNYYNVKPITSVESYNSENRKVIEHKQKEKMKERANRPPRRKGQKRRSRR